jgi:hypothetical protein
MARASHLQSKEVMPNAAPMPTSNHPLELHAMVMLERDML